MVPVRKPGRPLSACPHPKDQACGCGSVTAAIPRKQTCHCGSGSPSQDGAHTPSRPIDASGTELPSPNKPTFRVGKIKPHSSRKQSFDVGNLDRMDANQVNVQYDRSQAVPVQFQNGYAMAGPPPVYGYMPQYAAQMQPQYMVPLQLPPHSIQQNSSNGFSNGVVPHNSLSQVMESPMPTPTTFGNGDPGKFANGKLNGQERSATNGGEMKVSNGGSCCAPKQNGHSHTSSSSSDGNVPESNEAGCCSTKAPKSESKSSTQSTPQMAQQILPQNGMHFNPVLYPQYVPQQTVFSYPATYGSFQNPLQPSAWRQGVRTNYYSQPSFPPSQLPYDASVDPGSVDTIHTCGCGDTCQCIGCAAHPYNDATQHYVRSAYENQNQQSSMVEPYTNGHAQNGTSSGSGNGNGAVSSHHPEPVSSPTVHTPSSTTSGNGEEQNLSATDFFFVNYPFSGDGCGGDTQSCPCGDDCECLGCTIHRQPIPCAGDENGCLCGDDCQCIGCAIHKNVDLSGAKASAVDGPANCCGGSSST